jgi:hypothetical protein
MKKKKLKIGESFVLQTYASNRWSYNGWSHWIAFTICTVQFRSIISMVAMPFSHDGKIKVSAHPKRHHARIFFGIALLEI